MPIDEELADRVRFALRARVIAYEEKRMMGGLCFMVDGKMCVCIVADQLMARIGTEAFETALKRRGCGPMDLTGRPMRGFVLVSPTGLQTERDLAHWIDLALEYNPQAKAAPKRRMSSPRKATKSPRPVARRRNLPSRRLSSGDS